MAQIAPLVSDAIQSAKSVWVFNFQGRVEFH